jgi:parvulin-like peptidyl-prolyl isomerase
MTQEAGISPTVAADVLDDLRTRRGLGPTRFDSLLRRNAALRRLVRDSVRVSNPEIEAALAARYAERVNTRIIVVRTEREASNLRAQLKDVSDSIAVRFAQLAMQHSLDASAPRGGLLDPFSLEDATYPIALRQAIQSLGPGEFITPTIALDGGYAIVLLEGRSPSPYPRRSGDESMIEQQIRLRKERIAMDQLARRLLDAAGVTVFDESLAWSWSRRSR